jgi:predicted Zn-ribbon and HTH transcriptional regulator
MSDLTKRDTEVLMRLVDAEIKRICDQTNADDPKVPHIEVQCAECGFLFDLKFSTDCPACHHTGVRYARLVSEEETKERYGTEAKSRLRTALDRNTEWQAPGAAKDIAELDRMFTMEDTRP